MVFQIYERFFRVISLLSHQDLIWPKSLCLNVNWFLEVSIIFSVSGCDIEEQQVSLVLFISYFANRFFVV